AKAVAVVVNTEPILGRLRNTADQCRRCLLGSPDIAVDRISFTGYAKIERTDICEEPPQILQVDRIAEHRCGRAVRARRCCGARVDLTGDLLVSRRRSEILIALAP